MPDDNDELNQKEFTEEEIDALLCELNIEEKDEAAEAIPDDLGTSDELEADDTEVGGDETPPGSAPPQPTSSPTPLQRQPWPLVVSVGATVIAVLALLTAGFALRPAGELNDFREEVISIVDGKIASASEEITAKADAAIAAASEDLETVGQQQQKMMDDIIRISLQQKETADNVVSLATRVVAVESEMDKYKKSISKYNSAMRAIAEQSTRAVALARTALATEEVQVFITKANFLYNKADLLPAMKAELEQAGFRNGSKQILAVFGTADQGRSDERNSTLVRERSKNGADWLGSVTNGRGGEYPAVVDPFDGANCRKLVIVYRLASTASAPQ